MPQMNFDLEDGKPPVSFVLKPEDCARFVAFMRECDEGKKNAERYSWLRQRHEVLCRMYTAKGLGLDLSAVYVRSAEQFDGVIDAAIDAATATQAGDQK